MAVIRNLATKQQRPQAVIRNIAGKKQSSLQQMARNRISSGGGRRPSNAIGNIRRKF